MPIVSNLQPLPVALPGLRALSWAAGVCIPIGISRDRRTFFGRTTGRFDSNYDHLFESSNDGQSWTVLPQVFAEPVEGFVEKDDGEVMVITMAGASTPGYVYISTGWAVSHTTATFTKTLTTVGGNLPAHWSGHFCTFGKESVREGSGSIGVVCEYGGQTTASGDQTTKATRAYLTRDGGKRWEQILNLQTRYPGAYPLHLHAIAYDSYANRVWATYGDTATPAGPGKQGLLYSDDLGRNFSDYPLPAEMGADYLQSTGIGVFADCVIITSDNVHGILRIPRKGYRVFGPTQILSVKYGNGGSGLIGMGIHQNRNQPDAPILSAFQSAESTFDGSIAISLDGGRRFSDLWKDGTLNKIGNGALLVFGPSANGIILAAIGVGADYATTYTQLRGELVLPDAGMFDGSAVFTGDGATTVFNVAHGLPVAPTRLQAWSTNAQGPAFTLTATSTNLVFTFSAAPAVGVNPAVAYRFV